MMKFDHLNLPVSDLDRSRDWYVSTLGLKVEFEIAASRTVSLQDGEGFAIFLQEKPGVAPNGTALWFQVTMSTRSSPNGRRAALPSAMGRRKISGDMAPSSSIPTAISCACGTSARCGRNRRRSDT